MLPNTSSWCFHSDLQLHNHSRKLPASFLSNLMWVGLGQWFWFSFWCFLLKKTNERWIKGGYCPLALQNIHSWFSILLSQLSSTWEIFHPDKCPITTERGYSSSYSTVSQRGCQAIVPIKQATALNFNDNSELQRTCPLLSQLLLEHICFGCCRAAFQAMFNKNTLHLILAYVMGPGLGGSTPY